MGGPSSSVILSAPPSSSEWLNIRSVIQSISQKVTGDHFMVRSTLPINGIVESDGRWLGLDYDSIDEKSGHYEPEEMKQIEQKMGVKPRFDLGIYANCNQPEDHRILGELTLYLAELLEGIVDFEGAIYDYHLLPEQMKEGMWLWTEADWSEVKPYHEQTVAGIAGSIEAIEDLTQGGKSWPIHVCDPEFLRNWLQSPYFRMIK